jgi:hypothetical protein
MGCGFRRASVGPVWAFRASERYGFCLFHFFSEQTNMAPMTKASGARLAGMQGSEQRSRRKRGHGDSNHAFLRAFADALRDILHYERRRAA